MVCNSCCEGAKGFPVKRSCITRDCPECYEKWAYKEAKKASWRIWTGTRLVSREMRRKRFRLLHCVVSFLGHHTLRRTAGRLMWLAEMPIETIASVMGHADTAMTLLYIGVNLDDQAKAFDAVRNMRIQSQKTAKIVPSLAEPVAMSGPNRI
jgi:integrase